MMSTHRRNRVALLLASFCPAFLAYTQAPPLRAVGIGPFEVDKPFTVEIRVGDTQAPVSDFYGISFKLQSDSAACAYVDKSAGGGPFLGGDSLFFSRLTDAQSVDLAVSRTYGRGVEGSGVVARVRFIAGAAGRYLLSFRNVLAQNHAGDAIALMASPAAIDVAESSTASSPAGGAFGIPSGFTLEQNYPNPFNPDTRIRYGLPQRSRVSLSVYNLLGQQVVRLVEREEEAGYHEAQFQAVGLSSGVYFFRIAAVPVAQGNGRPAAFTQTRRMVLSK